MAWRESIRAKSRIAKALLTELSLDNAVPLRVLWEFGARDRAVSLSRIRQFTAPALGSACETNDS